MTAERFGNYQLLRKLAAGGMAELYLARQTGVEGFEKFVVVKRILPHLAENEEFVRMFLDEARIAARLNHPNIVHIYNLGSEDNSYFIAMEYIHGEDVRRVWRRADTLNKPFPIPHICRIIMEAANGLDYAHKKTDVSGKPLNIVHRDVSPQNIIVSFDGGVKVVDFGIAKAANQVNVTRTGILKGKYSYMSPEQASGQRVDHRTDVFALGVVMYELLTGRRLFKRNNDIQTLHAVVECSVAPPSKIESRVPKTLDAVVLKALTKSPSDRYADAHEFQGALETWLLENKMPSTSSLLSNYMHEIYAERLERDKEMFQALDAENVANLQRDSAKEHGKPQKRPTPPQPDVSSEKAPKPKRATGLESTQSLAEDSLSDQEEATDAVTDTLVDPDLAEKMAAKVLPPPLIVKKEKPKIAAPKATPAAEQLKKWWSKVFGD